MLIAMLFALSCNPSDKNEVYTIKIRNQSNRTVSVFYDHDFPDTLSRNVFSTSCIKVPPFSDCDAKSKGWKYDVARNSSGVITFQFQDEHADPGSDTVVLRRYFLTRDSLERLNWTITYP